MLLQNLYVPLSVNGAFTDGQVTHDAMGTNTPTVSSQMLTFKLCVENNLDGPFPFYP